MNRGKELEAMFDRGLKKAAWSKEFMIVRETDFPLFAIKQSNIRFKPPQMPDRLLLSKLKSYAVEIKSTQSASFPLQNIKAHQIAFLQEFDQKVGTAYLLIGFPKASRFFALHINEFVAMMNTMRLKD